MIKLSIDRLITTQHYLRHYENIPLMVDNVKNGAIWSESFLAEYARIHNHRPSPIIQISEFEDGKLFIHDGLHRITATKIAGRNFLHEEEYCITKWKYSDYTDINFEKKWITPFDPRTECRLPDLSAWKKSINDMLRISSKEEVERHIRLNKHLYCQARRFNKIDDLLSEIIS